MNLFKISFLLVNFNKTLVEEVDQDGHIPLFKLPVKNIFTEDTKKILILLFCVKLELLFFED